jgi:hypothetical protein
MKYAIEMDSGAMKCIPSFIKFGVSLQKLIWERDTETYTGRRSHKPTLGKYAKTHVYCGIYHYTSDLIVILESMQLLGLGSEK